MREKTALSTLITLEMVKLFSQAEGEVELSADILDYYAKTAKYFLADKKLEPELMKPYQIKPN
jgi:succinate-semialdehyde dehydrogenase/glutarate-semialdehyde dehydrogenase